MQDIIEAAQYLQGVNIIKLQSAARLAGLRWKSGAPGYDKAGIIEKLQQSPSIMRATVSALRRMEGGNPAPAPSGLNPFAEALEDEREFSPSPSPAPALPSLPAHNEGLPSALLDNLIGRVGELETKAPRWITHAQADDTARMHSNRMREALMPHIEGLTTRVKELETRAPVQFTIGEIKLPPISGQHERFPRMAKWLAARFHVLLIGHAGTGKTTAAIAFAEMMGLNIYAQPLCMDYTGVTGFITATGEVIETEFTRAWKNGGVLLWDELSMSAPDAVGALNSALANGFLALPGVGNVKAHPDFYLIAGDNSDTGASVQFNARTLLDGATLDRFVRIEWPVDLTLETGLAAGEASWLACVRAIRAFISQRDIQHVGATSRAVIQGAKALKTGAFTRAEILEDTCKKGALAAEWNKVINLPAVRAFLQGA